MTQPVSWNQDEALFRLVIESVVDYAIFILDPHGYIRSWNRGAERIKGYRADEIVGQHFSRFYGVDDIISGKAARVLDTATVQGRHEEEGWRIRKDGSRFWAHVVITAIRDHAGELLGFAKVTRDNSDRHASLEQLNRTADEVRQLLTILDNANILIRDLQDRIMLWSAGAAQLYGYTKQQALNAVSHELLNTTFRTPLEDLRNELFNQGRWQGEMEHRKSDKTTITVATTWVLHRNAHGQPVAILETHTDITRQKNAEQALTRLAERLEEQVAERTRRLQEANAELQAFAYTVAHDLRSPLRAMQGFSQAVLEDYGDKLDDTGRDYLTRNTKAAEELDGLIEDLLAYSKLSRAEVPTSPVSLDHAIHEVVQSLQQSVSERKARILVNKPLPAVLAHPSTLNQVIQNLLTNALKFVPTGQSPDISVWSEEHDKKVRLSIQDNGIGIPQEQHGRIFRVFERLHGGEIYDGTGIGLAIVQKGVERMGGQVGLDSTPGKGSRFWIDLKKVESSNSEAHIR
jgi:PAS domain S-box-containing protein